MSFIADLLGNIAKAGADTLGDITTQNAREREMQLQNELALKRAEEAEKLRIKLQDDRDLAKQKRLSEQSQEVEAAVPAVTAARQLGEAQGRAPSVDGNVLDIIKSKLTPAQLKEFYGVDTGPVATIDDQLKVARSKGFYDIEAGLKSARNETVAAIKAEFDQRMQQARLDQGDARLEQTIRRGDQQHAEAMARINKSDKDKSDEKLASLTSRKNQALRALSNYDRAGVDKADPDYQAEVEELRTVNALLKAQGKNNGAPASAAAPTPPPAGMTAIGKTPGGQIVYQTADGKKVVGK